MVTIRSDHPHAVVSTRPTGELNGAVSLPKSTGSKTNTGRHRARLGWNLYRPGHQDPERSGLARFLPAWRYRSAPSKPTPHDLPPPKRTYEAVEPNRSEADRIVPAMSPPVPAPESTVADGLKYEEPPTPAPANGSLPDQRTVMYDPPTDPLIDPTLPSRPATVQPSGHAAADAMVLAKSRLLPTAHPADGSSLAALLGFGETEASFGRDWGEGNGSSLVVDTVNDPWHHLPSLSTVTAELDRPGNTGDAIKLLWDATSDMDADRELPYVDGADARFAHRSSRRIRWSFVVSSVILVVLIGATVKVVSDLPGREAEIRTVQYTTAARQLSDALLPIEQSLGTAGLMSDSGLSTLTGQLNTLEGAARASATLASEQLPRAPIVGSRLPIDELVLPKRLLESASTQALGVEQRTGDAITYSLALSTAFDLPPLPAEASPAEVDQIAEQLSFSIVETRLALTGLPDDPLFGVFGQQASVTATLVEQAQSDYIVALRDGDTTAAADASAVIHDSISTLRNELNLPLERVQNWALDQITQVRGTVTEIESIVAT